MSFSRPKLRWLRIPDNVTSFVVIGEPFVCTGLHRRKVPGGTLESVVYQPAVMVRDESGSEFAFALDRPGFPTFFEPYVAEHGGRWEGIGFDVFGAKDESGQYRAVLNHHVAVEKVAVNG